MTTPLSIRFTPSLLARLRQRASAMPGASAAGLAQRLIDEGLRMAVRCSIRFTGTRIGLVYPLRTVILPAGSGPRSSRLDDNALLCAQSHKGKDRSSRRFALGLRVRAKEGPCPLTSLASARLDATC